MQRPSFYEFGEFRVDLRERVLWRGSELIVLPHKVFETLHVLIRNGGRIVEREELMQQVWADTFVEEGNLSVNISFLRKTLGKDTIETVPRRGYRFVPEVRAWSEEDKQLASLDAPAQTAAKHSHKRRIAAVATVSFAILAAGFGVYLSSFRNTPAVTSLAVLPFQNVSSEDVQYLTDGLADRLTNSLSQLRGLKVIAQTSMQRYKGKQVDPKEIGRALNVQELLLGRVEQYGDRLSLNVELVNSSDASQVWGKHYDMKLSDIVSLQNQIAQDVSRQLRSRGSEGDQMSLTKKYTENPEAYRLYLKGKYFCAQWTKDGFAKGTDYFNQALSLDPNFALAYDGLAYCYYATDFWAPWKEATAKGRMLVNRALQIDPNLAEAHTSLALISTWGYYDWANAEKEFKEALRLNPNYAPAHLWYGFLLLALHRIDESIAETKLAVELDPLSADANSGLGVYLFYAGRYDEAQQQLKSTIELEPTHWFSHLYLARVSLEKGDVPAAIAELEKTKQMDGASAEVWSALGYSYAISGRTEQARKMLAELNEQMKQSYVSPYNFAVIHAGLGEKDKAFAYLEKEYLEGTYYLNYLQLDPQLQNLRSDPRYTALVQRMALPNE